jgi:hypothetical protein
MTLCTYCLERDNREVEAHRIVAGTPMCEPCYSGKSRWDREATSEAIREGWRHKDFTHRGARRLPRHEEITLRYRAIRGKSVADYENEILERMYSHSERSEG